MPIYAYRCGACGHARDVLQRLSDPVLSTCPACGAEAFAKQLTAAGFQLKGSGWYATDFKGGGTPKPADGEAAAAPAADKADGGKTDSGGKTEGGAKADGGGKTDGSGKTDGGGKTDSKASAAASTTAAADARGGSCAGH